MRLLPLQKGTGMLEAGRERLPVIPAHEDRGPGEPLGRPLGVAVDGSEQKGLVGAVGGWRRGVGPNRLPCVRAL